MKQTTAFPLCLFLLAVVAFDGCSRQSKFADRIGSANHLLVLKRTGPREAVSMSIEGEEVNAIVRAASSATPKAREGGPAPAYDAEIKIAFLKGSNVLAVVIANEGRFPTDDKEYVDGTGALSALGSIPSEKWRPASYRAISKAEMNESANKITRANAGGLRQLPARTRWAARIAQFRRWGA